MDIEFTLKRRYFNSKYTIGKLTLGDYIICDTLEDTVRDYNKDGDLEDEGETKIFGETAIPYGRYRVIVNISPKFQKRLPRLLNVKHFEGILIHSGVTPEHTHGCILVGENKEKGKVFNGRYYQDLLVRLIDEYIINGHEVFINVI